MLLVLASLLAACAGPTPTLAPKLATCGGRTFPVSGLDAPTGEEKQTGPEFDALRAALLDSTNGVAHQGPFTWRLAGRDDRGAVFLANTQPAGPPAWLMVEVVAGSSGWHAVATGGCNLLAVIPADLKPATWSLDPAFPVPAPGTTDLHVLVWGYACNGGAQLTGQIAEPLIEYSPTSITITIGLRPPAAKGPSTCPGGPGTPDVVHLAEPLGPRTLLDGIHVPPARPTPMF